MKTPGKALRAWTGAGALLLLAAAPAAALQILQAADHAELIGEVSSTSVSRIALENDRIARVVRSAGPFTIEHDPVRGDVYLYPDRGAFPAGGGVPEHGLDGAEAVTLYLGTERGLTYRLSLTPVARESAQILIRNRSVANMQQGGGTTGGNADPQGYGNALASLVRAAAKGAPLPGYVIVSEGNSGETGDPVTGTSEGISVVEVWRGSRFVVYVLHVRTGAADDAEMLAALFGHSVAAAWLDPADSLADGSAADGSPPHDSSGDDGAARSGPEGGGAAGAPAPARRLGVVIVDNLPWEPRR